MKANNPMRNLETRRKMIASNKGRTFLARGGNGQLTTQQKALRDATGLPVEFVIITGPVKHLFSSLPNHYKVDLADPLRKLAIEIDGKTHKLKKWKFFDKRKTAVLTALGWSVLRFWNHEVTNDLPSVVKQIRTFTVSG